MTKAYFSTLTTLLFLLFLQPITNAQDTLVYQDGSQVVAQLDPPGTLRGRSEIRYRKDGKFATANAADLRELRYGDGGGRYLTSWIELPPEPDGTKPRELRFGYLIADGAQRLVKVPLSPQDYFLEVKGSKNYLYLLTTNEQTYQIDLFDQIGSVGNYAVSTRYRNELAYIYRDCEAAASSAKTTSFTDRSMLALLNDGRSCETGEISYLDESRVAGPTRNAHSLEASYLVSLNEVASNDGASFGIGYVGEYGVARLEKFTILAGLGLYRLAYRLDNSSLLAESVSQVMIRAHLMGNFYLQRTETNSIQLAGGYAIFNKLGTSDGIIDKQDDSYGMFKFQVGYGVNRLTFSLVYQFVANVKNIRPGSFGELAVRYRLSK